MFLGINYASESYLRDCGVDSTALPVQNTSKDSVRLKWTGRKSKIKQNRWNMDPNDRGLDPELNRDALQVFLTR